MNYSKITDLREKNNKNTVDILRLAFTYYPKEAKNLLIKVNEGDGKISKLLEELTEKNHNIAELIIAKQRHGTIGTIKTQFDANITKFNNLAKENYDLIE